jgi:hypothetical protein
MTFECLAGCGKCCWPVPIPRETWDRHQDKVQREVLEVWSNLVIGGQVLPITADLLCPFLTECKRCAIHDDRPEVCRNFGKRGHSCPYVKPDGTPRTDRGVKQYQRINRLDLETGSNVTLIRRVPAKREGYLIEVTEQVTYRRIT